MEDTGAAEAALDRSSAAPEGSWGSQVPADIPRRGWIAGVGDAGIHCGGSCLAMVVRADATVERTQSSADAGFKQRSEHRADDSADAHRRPYSLGVRLVVAGGVAF